MLIGILLMCWKLLSISLLPFPFLIFSYLAQWSIALSSATSPLFFLLPPFYLFLIPSSVHLPLIIFPLTSIGLSALFRLSPDILAQQLFCLLRPTKSSTLWRSSPHLPLAYSLLISPYTQILKCSTFTCHCTCTWNSLLSVLFDYCLQETIAEYELILNHDREYALFSTKLTRLSHCLNYSTICWCF